MELDIKCLCRWMILSRDATGTVTKKESSVGKHTNEIFVATHLRLGYSGAHSRL